MWKVAQELVTLWLTYNCDYCGDCDVLHRVARDAPLLRHRRGDAVVKSIRERRQQQDALDRAAFSIRIYRGHRLLGRRASKGDNGR